MTQINYGYLEVGDLVRFYPADPEEPWYLVLANSKESDRYKIKLFELKRNMILQISPFHRESLSLVIVVREGARIFP